MMADAKSLAIWLWGAIVCMIILAAILADAYGQSVSVYDLIPSNRKPTEFYFARLEYTSIDPLNTLKDWYTDYPDMDNHVVKLVNRMTNVRAAAVKVKPESSTIFRYPILYIVEPEMLKLTEFEVKQLREYIKRGGVLFMDDFHGQEDLEPVLKTLNRILPGTQMVELDTSHPLFHIFFDIPKVLQVVNDGLAACAERCDQWENGETGRVPHVYGVFDMYGDMQVIMAYNTDLGDGLEFADAPDYPLEQSIYATKLITNVIIYAMSH
jgi:hypothetical protein